VFDAALVFAYHLVMALVPLSAAGAIVVFTVGVRTALLPLSVRAVRGERARARIAPRLAELQAKHAGDRAAMAAAYAELKRTEGAGPLSGCLPALAQLPFFFVLYRLFISSTVDGAPNELLGHKLWGVHLGTRFLADPGAPVFWVMFVALAAIALWTAVWTARRTPSSADSPPAVGLLVRVLPFTTVVFAAWLPLAAGIYLVTTTAWSAGERLVLRR
jgi:YidC/Oxa1 family membrane protein insertase